MSFRDKRSRYQCYASRDRYWECLDTLPPTPPERQDGPPSSGGGRATAGVHQAKYGVQLQPQTDAEGALKPCMELRRLCLQSCPEQWMKHFDRKRQYMLFRENVAAVGNMTAAGDVALASGSCQPPSLGLNNQQGNTTPATADARPPAHTGRIPTINLPDEAKEDTTHSPSFIQRPRSMINIPLCLDFDNSLTKQTGVDSTLVLGYSPSTSLLPSLSSPGSTLQKLFNPLPPDPAVNEPKASTVGASLLLSLQVQPVYSSSPSPSPSHSPTPSPVPSPSVSPIPSPSSPEASAVDMSAGSSLPLRPPPRRHRVYSQVVYRQRLVPTK